MCLRLFIIVLFLTSTGSSWCQEFYKENLGPNINTKYDETKPIISPDGRILYFARQFYPENVKGEKDPQDIYYALEVEGEWSKAVNIGEPLNNKYPNGVSAVSPDGEALIVINGDHRGGSTSGGASISHKISNYWTAPEKLKIADFYNDSPYADYFLSNNEMELFMTLQRNDSHGDQDIYVSFKKEDGSWTGPLNLGKQINSSKAEFAPFLAADNRTLFFSSDGHGGYGGSDIFYARRLDDTWTNWSKPVNLGSEINSKGFEGYYTIPAKGSDAYFVSSEGSIDGSKDIFKIKIAYEFRPDPVALIYGNVFDTETKAPLNAKIYFIEFVKENNKESALSHVNDGKYSHILQRGSKYEIIAEKEGYFGVSQIKDLTALNEYVEIETDIEMVPIKEGQTFNTYQIFFDDYHNLEPTSEPELNRIYQLLKKYPALKLEIGGHYVNLQSGTENLDFSKLRASIIRKHFVFMGVHPGRLTAAGYGRSALYTSDDKTFVPEISNHNRISFKILSTSWNVPRENDQDGDGILDVDDECATEAGMATANGCPDDDRDGFANNIDECPELPGYNDGCPNIARDLQTLLDSAPTNINFESGRDILLPESYNTLDQIAQHLENNPNYKLKIACHTDSQGDEGTNMILSERRAKRVADYLIAKGILANRLETFGYGETKPIASNDTQEGREANRRVEISIIF